MTQSKEPFYAAVKGAELVRQKILSGDLPGLMEEGLLEGIFQAAIEKELDTNKKHKLKADSSYII